jgi:hypothetical protein
MKHLLLLLSFCTIIAANAQKLDLKGGNRFLLKTEMYETEVPVFSFRLNEVKYFSDKLYKSEFPVEIKIESQSEDIYTIQIANTSEDTLDISNIVPFGESDTLIYITATGPWALARASLFRPDCIPVSVTLPDNNWDLGYASFRMKNGEYIGALTKRGKVENARKRRYKTILYPDGKISFDYFIETGGKDWQDMLTNIFRENKLYCHDNFDNSLYERSDLNWIKDAYLIILQFAWDKEFYDWKKSEYNFKEFFYSAG